jgi:phosphoadenosine phosphosulfate reductase
MLFPETIAYQSALAQHLKLQDVRRIQAQERAVHAADPVGRLHYTNPTACCDLRKVAPLAQALGAFDVILTGRKRHQSASRAALQTFEQDGNGRLRINPLAHWSRDALIEYRHTYALPPHPLVAQGYPSLGCAPCTTPVAQGEDPRAGRWRGQDKEECGIHFADGKAVRAQTKDTAA